MAVRTILITRIDHVVSLRETGYTRTGSAEGACAVVTFEAHGENNRSAQQLGVGRAVRVVTHFATFDSNWRVFECKRSALIRVAVEARFLVSQCLPDEWRPLRHSPRRRERAMWIMAIATGHEALFDPVLEWHREISTDVGVAPVAKLWLGLG